MAWLEEGVCGQAGPLQRLPESRTLSLLSVADGLAREHATFLLQVMFLTPSSSQSWQQLFGFIPNEDSLGAEDKRTKKHKHISP